MQHVLFVGCAVHTAHYESLFPGRDFVTIDVDPTKARYGARRHVVDTIANLESHFEADTLDVVVCNGVIGWGLDRADEIDCAASQCFECLRPGGVFIIGWNDIPERRPIAFNDLEGFRRFARLTLPPFPGPVYPTLGPSRHVYNFYMKPRGAR
jgi:SAM-dependent methyltransferase